MYPSLQKKSHCEVLEVETQCGSGCGVSSEWSVISFLETLTAVMKHVVCLEECTCEWITVMCRFQIVLKKSQ